MAALDYLANMDLSSALQKDGKPRYVRNIDEFLLKKLVISGLLYKPTDLRGIESFDGYQSTYNTSVEL